MARNKLSEAVVKMLGDLLDDGELIPLIQENCEPEEVFDDEILGRWAEDNGYVKE